MTDNFVISTDKSRLDVQAIHSYLNERSYWAKGRSLETVQKSIDKSLCFGIYDQSRQFVGFARVVTDSAIFAYIMDVFILEDYRGKGLGKRLIEYILDFPELNNLARWHLVTDDAHGFYKKCGFSGLAAPEKHMEKVFQNH